MFFYVYKSQSDLNIQGEQPKQLASLSLGEFFFVQECFLLQFHIFFQHECLSSNVYLFKELVKSIKLIGSNEGSG
jgi:hypothetical protein